METLLFDIISLKNRRNGRMVEKIVSKVLQWMQGKELCELKNALYSVLSDYEISEKSTAVQKIERSWEEELGIFLVRKR